MEIIIVGAGGHGKVVRDLARFNASHQLIAILDDQYEELKLTKEQWYVGPVSYASQFLTQFPTARVLIAIGDNQIRKSIVSKLGLTSEHYVTLIHPSAVISPSARIGKGTVVMANAVIQADAVIGDHAIINSGAIIEHDAHAGDYAHIAPRVTITGGVRVQEGVMVGAGATVIPGQCIKQWAIVGAGSVVINEIPAYSTVAGSPARVIKPELEASAIN